MAKCWKLKMWHFEHNIMGHWLYSWSAPNLTQIDPHNNWVINLVVNFSCHATRRDSKVVDEQKTKKIIGSKVDVPNKILDTDLCITKSVVKLMWARKKQTPTHAAKMTSQIKYQTTIHVTDKNSCAVVVKMGLPKTQGTRITLLLSP